MAYSRFGRQNLYNTKSLSLYPEEQDRHISFRHKNLLPNIATRLNVIDEINKSYKHHGAEIHTSAHMECPIYVHNYTKISHNDGDSVPKAKYKVSKNKHKVFEKIEETYWANWKPDKISSTKSNIPQVITTVKKNTPKIHVIKSAPDRKKKTKNSGPETQFKHLAASQIKARVLPEPKLKNSNSKEEVKKSDKIKTITSKSQEIQTESEITPLLKTEDKVIVGDKSDLKENKCEDLIIEEKFLKHTDSLILNKKKQQEIVEHFEQPTCIRLYKKSQKPSARNYIKGGTYTLKSCLKTETKSSKNPKLNRPGSPIIMSSNYSTKNKTSKLRRH